MADPVPGTDDASAAGQPTDEQHEWVTQAVGIDPRSYSAAEDAPVSSGAAESGPMSSDATSPPEIAASAPVEQGVEAGPAVQPVAKVQTGGAATAGTAAGGEVPANAPDEQGGGSNLLAALPLPSPETVAEIEEAAVSGVRAVVNVAPKVVEGAALVTLGGPLILGIGVAAAILTYSKDAGPAWDGMTNPETGKKFTSQEEYDQWVAGGKKQRRQQRKGADIDADTQNEYQQDPDNPPLPKPDGPGKCENTPYDRCGPGTYDTEAELLAAPENQSWATRRVGGPSVQGRHWTYYSSANHTQGTELGSTNDITCCIDTPDGPIIVVRRGHAP